MNYVDYKKFSDDIYYINKKYRSGNKDDKGRENEEEETKSKEYPISVRPSHNMPNDNRYSIRNTVVGRFPDSRKSKKHVIRLSDSILQEIIKGTYLRDTFIEDAFMKFGQGRDRSLNMDDLKDAFDHYGIKMDSKMLKETYDRLKDREKELTAELIDLAVEDNAKKGIEEIQKSILEVINRGVKNQLENPIKELFLRCDPKNDGTITYEQFYKVVESFVPKMKKADAMFLAKRY